MLISLQVPQAVGICEDAGKVRAAIAWGKQHPERRVELEDLWAALHFALCGEYPIPRHQAEQMGLTWYEDSLENVLMGGTDTLLESSYGRARYLSPTLVRSLADELERLDGADIASRLTAQDLVEEKMLPAGWDPQEALGRLPALFNSLRALYLEARARGDGVLAYFE